MASAKIFLAGLYLHLFLSILTFFVLLKNGWNKFGILFFIFYLFMIAVVLLTGWITLVMAFFAHRKKDFDALYKSWELLKLGSIPFYIFNFIYSFIIWSLLVAASRGIFIVFVPIPIILTCTFILQSGCMGIICISLMRSYNNNGVKISRIHYFFQLIPVLDVISTLILLFRWKAY